MLSMTGIIGRIAFVTHFVYLTFFGDPKQANEAYNTILPTLRLAVNEYGRNSK